MTLKAQLQADLKQAMRDRDAPRKSALRMVLTSIQLAEVDAKGELDESDVITLVAKEVKRREDAVQMMRDAGRDELIAGEMVEIDILQAYLPKQLTEEALIEIVKAAIAEVGATSPKEMGTVMQVVMPQVKGQADGKVVNQIVRKLLG